MEQTTRRAGRPARISREQVLAAAVELADREGLEAVTMRRIGELIGAEAMSLYRHVEGKDDLLDGMVDVLFGEVALPSAEIGWQAALRGHAVSTRAALARHPWAIEVIESRLTPGPANLRYRDALLGTMRAAGFSAVDATRAINLVDSFVYGFVLQERTLPFDTSAEIGETGEALAAQIADEFPHLAAAAAELVAAGFVYADEFAFGLDLILDGLECRRSGD